MRLTKKRAVQITIRLWEWLAKTGKYKHEWPQWKHYGDMAVHCPLCEYHWRHWQLKRSTIRCVYCPYYQVFGYCNEGGSPFFDWSFARTKAKRQHNAAQFVNQLKQIQEKL